MNNSGPSIEPWGMPYHHFRRPSIHELLSRTETSDTNRKQMSFVLFMDSMKLEDLDSLVTTGHFTMTIGDADAFDESYFV